jgi:trans-aconitate methyltransferase
MKPFDEHYWLKHYNDLESMDGIGNRKDHALYLKSLFNLEGIKIKSIFDMGFGHGYLLKEISKTLACKKIGGIEPSDFVFQHKVSMPKANLKKMDIKTWLKSQKYRRTIYDLGLCNSVFQYLSDQDLKVIVPLLKKHFAYIYLTVPTDIEYQRQKKEFGFKDDFAHHRSRKFYYDLLSPHFTFLSLRVLESKYFFTERDSSFHDLLYRF